MRNLTVTIMVLLLAAVFTVSLALSQEDMTYVDNDMFDRPQRPPSVFNHDGHNEQAGIDECNACHHVYEDGQLLEDESSEDQRCSDCHDSKDADGRPSLTKAFHGNCKGCHQEGKKGPVMCGECHRNKPV